MSSAPTLDSKLAAAMAACPNISIKADNLLYAVVLYSDIIDGTNSPS
jgi:hypothetical protein